MKIKEIAEKAGVSVATVSHVVNKTRYVSPDLTERVLTVINESEGQPNFVLRKLNTLTSDVILCLAETLEDYFCLGIIKGIKSAALQSGYTVVVIHTAEKGLIREYIRMEKPCAMIIIADKNSDEDFFKLRELNIPTVTIGHAVKGADLGNVVIDYYENAYKATYYLIKNGHEKVYFIDSQQDGYVYNQMLSGYKDALKDNRLPFDPDFIKGVGSGNHFDKNTIDKILIDENRPTALVSADNTTTMELLRLLNNNNIRCPEDISIVSLNEFEMSHLLQPALSTVAFDPVEIGLLSINKLNAKLNGTDNAKDIVVGSKLHVRDSTQCIGKGPLGEKAESPDVLQLTPDEMVQVKSGSYTAAISFHYSGVAWARLHEKGIKDVFEELGVKVLAVMDAHFDPELQIKQHASILMMNPDVLISIPADEIQTAESYREVVNAGTKLVLIDNVPHGLERDDYVTCVSVNQTENGQNAGRILGEYLRKHHKKKIGLLNHGASFFATKQRDTVVEQVLREEFPELEIIANESFINEKRAFDKCYEMIKNHPEIEGLYVSWDVPAMEALSALRELNREDICIVTADLDRDGAMNIAMGGPIKGLSAQRPYQQGRAIALAAANALIGKKVPSYIGVKPVKVTLDNLLTGWQEVLREKPSTELINTLKRNNEQ
jgi:ribose transport system substrate-binding protein